MAISLGELAIQFGCELIGDPAVRVERVATLSDADSSSISFLANSAYREQLRGTRAAAVILRATEAEACPAAAIVAANPYLIYARVAALLYPAPVLPAGTHPSAVVAESAVIAATAHIAAHAVIGGGSIIGEHVVVGPGCVVGENCKLGAGTRLVANVTVVSDVVIGERCIVHPGAVIGCDGFGNAMSEKGWVKVPQVGGVRIGDDVEIGANTTIDRGAIGDTEIGNGVRIDNLVQIAHNVRVGDHTAMAAMTGISGSTVIGKRCMFGGQSGTVGHINICDDVVVTGNAMVTKDIDKPGAYAGAFAAEPSGIWKRQVARFRRLDAMAAQLASIGKNRDKHEQ